MRNLTEDARNRIRKGAIHSNQIQRERFLAKYRDKPKECANCKKILPYNKRYNKYCNHSCAASVCNLGETKNIVSGLYKKKSCIVCGRLTKNQKYCSLKCNIKYKHDNCINRIKSSGKLSGRTDKKYLIEIRGYKCEICNIYEWLNQPIPLILDHINGNSDDCRLENLRLICSNCDSLLPTYKAKNKGNGRAYRRERYHKGLSY